MFELSLPDHVERLDQPLEILVRLDVARVEDERIVQLVALLTRMTSSAHGLLAEPLVDRVVDDVDLRFRHVEVAQDVALRGLRDRQHARRPVRGDPQRAARVRVAEPAGQVLRKAQVDAVVDRHDRAARRQRRQHVVRRVEQVDPLAAQIERQRELLAHRVVRRALGNGPEVLAELGREWLVLGRQRTTYSFLSSMRARCRSRLRM